MRAIMILATAGAVAVVLAAGAAANPGAGSGTIDYRATATFSDGSSADRLFAVAAGDLDGDGLSDTAWLRVACDRGQPIKSFIHYEVKAPRDVATGQASGKRTHKPFTIVKEWGASTPMLGKAGGGKKGPTALSWDLVQGKGSRTGHSGASDASAGKGAAGERATYDVKKNEGGRLASVGKPKTMAWDDWHEAKLTAGAADVCG